MFSRLHELNRSVPRSIAAESLQIASILLMVGGLSPLVAQDATHAPASPPNRQPRRPSHTILALDQFSSEDAQTGGFGWASPWKRSALRPGTVSRSVLSWPPGSLSLSDQRALLIRGTGDRNNPFRRQLATLNADKVFVRFLFRYEAQSIDNPPEGDGEFFVVWLDGVEGTDRDTHSNRIPNFGVHVATEGPLKGRTVFMTRLGVSNAAFTRVPLEGDRTYLVVACFSKSVPGAKSHFDTCEMWIDPEPDAAARPNARARMQSALKSVHWTGFSTGQKTESQDRIWIDNFAISDSWQSILGLPVPRPDVPETTDAPTPALPPVAFSSDVLPILKSQCFSCHSGNTPDSGISLDHLDGLLEHVVPGQSSKSPLVAAVLSANPENRMPPPDSDGSLTKEQQQILTRWIDEGLDWDESLLPSPSLSSDHWAFQPLSRPSTPDIASLGQSHSAIDAFLDEQRRRMGVSANSTVDRRHLIRRLSLTLTGLPPTPEVVNSFVKDSHPAAYERLIESLLASPGYGERWGRHWLDLARWAESNGHQHNRDRPHAWRYRDYVISTFNQHVPFDQFTHEQIAGDTLVPYRDRNVIATGFLTAARYSGNQLDKTIQRNDIMVDITNTTGAAFLGLTLECAQCHNHKTDPITARDYYRFQGFFLRGQPRNVVLHDTFGDGYELLIAQAVRERRALFDAVHARMYAAERKRRPVGDVLVTPSAVLRSMNSVVKEQYSKLTAKLNKASQTWAFYSPNEATQPLATPRSDIRWPLPLDVQPPIEPRLLVRGDPGSPGPNVGIGWPSVLDTSTPTGSEDVHRQNPLTRRDLAHWLTSRRNPLTARVWVNRIWQYHFGRGIVETSSNFGARTAEPRMVKLLDWLAVELIESGWDTRHIQRLILNSQAYQLSAAPNTAMADRDPANVTFWRWTMRRVEAEAIRDSMLMVSGELNRKMNGPGTRQPNAVRRSIYQFQKRDNPDDLQRLFDGPNMVSSCSRRRNSTTPIQPLYLLNSDFVRQRARRLATRIRTEAGNSEETQIGRLYELVLARPPTAVEKSVLHEFLDEASVEDRLVDLCQVMLNTNEFLYVP